MNRLLTVGLLCTLGLSSCGSAGSGFENPFTIPVPLTMVIQPSTVTMEPGTSTHVAVSVKTAAGQGLTAALNAAGTAGIDVIPDSSGLTIHVLKDTVPGSYSVPVTGQAGSGTAQSALTVTVAIPKSDTPKAETP